MVVFVSLVLVALATAGWLMLEPGLVRRRRQRLLTQPVPPHWPAWILARVPFAQAMPARLLDQVLGFTRLFLHEKAFVGCNGLTVTEEMRVVIGFQACLLVANRPGVPDRDFYDALRSILVYPAAFLVEETHHHDHGLVTTHRRALSGQAWEATRLILSWDDIENPEGAGNVVLHEFAHYLDMENDVMDGAPALASGSAYTRWSEAFRQEYEQLHLDLTAGIPTLLDPYAATEPAEFFAVVTEVFFGQPAALRARHPRLYRELAAYYRLDPAMWPGPPDNL